jgi:Gpi18-like mannosyltransferase
MVMQEGGTGPLPCSASGSRGHQPGSSSLGDGPVGPAAFWALVLAYMPLRLWLATLPGYVLDLDFYKRCAIGVARFGWAMAYEVTDFDYPPLFLYILQPIGTIRAWLEGDAAMDSPFFTFMIKGPSVVFDLLIAWILFRLVSGGLWGHGKTARGWARLAALAYLWNPAVLWSAGYSGYPDQIHTAFALAALALAAHERWTGSGAMLGLGGLMKPLVAPLVPLLGLLALLRARYRGLAGVALGGFGVAVVAFLPWILTGRAATTVERVLFDLNAMPYTTVQAHNLWWMLGARPAGVPLIGPLTPTVIGLAAFGIVLTALLLRSRNWILAPGKPSSEFAFRLFLLAAALSAAFFFLTTHLHENHLFLTLALLLCVAGRDPTLAWLAVGCSVALLLNVALYDLDLPYLLPLGLSAESTVIDPIYSRPFTWPQLIGGFFNAALVGAVTLEACVAVWRRGGALQEATPPAAADINLARA